MELSTPSLGITATAEWYGAIQFRIDFQLPLSGSRDRAQWQKVSEDFNFFQLPLSGSRWLEARESADQIARLSTPSLGITIVTTLQAAQRIQAPFNSLSRDHCLNVRGAGMSIAYSFNSLSRDHSALRSAL